MTRHIENEDWRGAHLRNIDMSGAKGVEINLADARLSGYIAGLHVNDIEVAPLIAREMERRYPERSKLSPSDEAGFREALDILQAQLETTWSRARRLTEAQRNERIDDEWSVVETIRHLIFVIDGWVAGIIGGRTDPYHPIGLPPSFLPRKPQGTSIDPDAAPTFEEALAVWNGRLETLETTIDRLTPQELDRELSHPAADTVRGALWVVLDEVWAHNRYMDRDLDVIEGSGP